MPQTVAQFASATGVSTTVDSIQADVLRAIMYKRTNLIETGTKLLPTLYLGDLEKQFEVPNEMLATYPVARAGVVVGSEKVTWYQFNLSLEQAQVLFMISDDATLRDMGGWQKKASIKRAATALAKAEDDEIIDAIEAGEYTSNTVTVASGAEWDAAGVDTDIEQNIVDAWGNIFANSNVIEQEMNNINLLVPAAVFAELLKLKLLGNAAMALRKYLKNEFSLGIYPSRHTSLTDDAYLLLNGEDTGVHGVLRTNKIPLVESERRIGTGNAWLTRKYFKTKITPYASGQTTSDRIAKITNVAA
jgi:hypothetical protein